jgi:predicted RND superfamily exporter protein
VSARYEAGRGARRFVRWTLRHGRVLWSVALLLAIPATWRTVELYRHIRGDLAELLPREAPSVVAIDELRARMPGLQFLGVVVDTGAAENTAAAERFLDDLAARVRDYPPSLVRAEYTGNGAERAFLEKHAPIYASLGDLRSMHARIVARRDYEVAQETGALLDEGSPPSLDFSDIEHKYEGWLPRYGAAEESSGRYASARLTTAVLLIELGGFSTSAESGRELLGRVKSDVRTLNPERYARGMRVGYAGDVAISVEETSALMQDLSTSSALVILAVVFVIAIYYRWAWSVAVLVTPLLLAMVYSFGIASLPPLRVTELNSNTGFLGSIIVGNGVNFGIVLLARYVEERRAGRGVEEALAVAVSGSRAGTLVAALAAGASYASLALTQFRGFQQFGYIGGLGMVLAWSTAFVLMPSLVAAIDRSPRTTPPPRDEATRWTSLVARLVTRHHRVVAIAGAVLVIGAVGELRGFSIERNIEYDLSKLRRADTWKTGEGYWGRRMDAVLGEYLTPTVILTDDAAEARAVGARLREEAAHPPLSEMLQTIRTIDDVLPTEQLAKIEEVNALRNDLTPRIRSLIPTGKLAQVERLLGSTDLAPIGLADLPRRFTKAMRERDGTTGRTVLVYPRQSRALWEGHGIEAFARALRDAAASTGGRPGRVAGSLPLSADILRSIRHDGPLASGAAFLGVVLVVVVLFRWKTTTAYVISALGVGVLWLAAATMALGVKINFANFIAFPITFGIGVDYPVNVMNRFVEDGERDMPGALRSTGSAVALCSLTTIIGYSSLLLAQNRALFLFGVVAVLGELACLTAALTVLPAVVEWAHQARRRTRVMGADAGRGDGYLEDR